MDYQDHLKTQFSQEELLKMASSLALDIIAPETETHVIIDRIRMSILENGPSDEPLVDEFIKIIKLYDDQEEFPRYLPSCFGYASDHYQECSYCAAYLKCGERLVENLPECFGILYSMDDWNCGQCMVNYHCKVSLPQVEEVEGTYEGYLPQDIPFLGNILTFLGRYRSVRYNWPEEVSTHKYGRFRSFMIRGVRWSESFYHVLKDAVYFGGPQGSKPEQRTPIVYDQVRQPISQQFPIRLIWEFKDE